MACSEAMISEVITGRPEMTVEEGLELFSKHGIRAVPVVDDKNIVKGIFNFHHLLEDILPVSVTFEEGISRVKHLEISLGGLSGEAPWVAHRLEMLLPKRLDEVMVAVTDMHTVKADTPLREGVRLLVKYGSPIAVVKDDEGTLAGIISSQSAVKALLKIKDELSEAKSEEK